jgi:FkbM family methyltransferase
MSDNRKSQVGQDKWLDDNVFKGKENGVFIEVGAFDGVYGSNTYFFEKEKNWKGILIEPHKLNFEEMVNKSNREKSIMENCAIDINDGEVDFLMMDGACDILSGIVEYYDDRHRRRINNELNSFMSNPFDHRHKTQQNVVKVRSQKLQTLIDKHELNNIDLCSIDVEGGELKVLKSIDFEKSNIYCFLIENNYGEKDVEEYLSEKGYYLLNKLQYDDVYIKK